jgi:hypothetical protein
LLPSTLQARVKNTACNHTSRRTFWPICWQQHLVWARRQHHCCLAASSRTSPTNEHAKPWLACTCITPCTATSAIEDIE